MKKNIYIVIVISLLNFIVCDRLYSQKIYFDVKNKVVEVNKIINKEEKINVSVKIDSAATVSGNIVVPKIGTSTYKEDYTCAEKTKITFSKGDDILIRNFEVTITSTAKTGTTFPIYLMDTSGKLVDAIFFRINKDTSQYIFDYMSFSVGASFAIDKQRINNQDLYTDFRFTKLDLFTDKWGVDAGVSSGVSTSQENLANTSTFYRRYYENIREKRFQPIDASVEKNYTVQTTAAWVSSTYMFFQNLLGSLHVEFRSRNFKQVNTVSPTDSVNIYRIPVDSVVDRRRYFDDTLKLPDKYENSLFLSTNEIIIAPLIAISFKGKYGEVFLKTYWGYRYEFGNNSLTNKLIEEDTLNRFTQTSRNCTAWGAQFRLIETTYGLKFGADFRGIGGSQVDMFIYVAKEFNISKLGNIFGL